MKFSNTLVIQSYLIRTVLLLFPGAQGGWVDPDTPENKRTTTSFIDGTEYKLVMSDEFNVPGRTFKDGDDPAWTALDKSDDDSSAAGGGSLHFYNSSMVSTTDDGFLEIRSVVGDTEWNHYDIVNKRNKHVVKHFKSGMVQSWNKFCFTGGIIEIDVIFPGDPYIGGLWPAIWMLGNLGRATYEGSTNNIWPWSFDKCDRKMQEAQALSACNAQNHYGLNPFQGRGATEIDLVEVMTGKDDGPLPSTQPGVSYPYADFTLQVAPGVPDNRPQSGSQPVRHDTVTTSGFTEYTAQTWYEGLETHGNTTLNPFFYGTYLGVTKPEEPVHRNKNQVFQADAIGAMHQLTPSHFHTMHTFRLEWQPGPGGRLDWFTKDYRVNSTYSITGDGNGQDWVHAYSIKDASLNLTGAQIPIEPSYLIMNTGISSTWGFPYNVPPGCAKCYDCENVTCACSFHPGFCNMMKQSRVSMYIDYVRVYQTTNHTAHVGHPHSVGCDPLDYPTREYIKGNEYRYMRSPPFVYDDTGPLRKQIKKGGGTCTNNIECGGIDTKSKTTKANSKGQCIQAEYSQGFLNGVLKEGRCQCYDGYTGPYCLTVDKYDDELGAMELRSKTELFRNLPSPALPLELVISVSCLMIGTFVFAFMRVIRSQRELKMMQYRKIPDL